MASSYWYGFERADGNLSGAPSSWATPAGFVTALVASNAYRPATGGVNLNIYPTAMSGTKQRLSFVVNAQSSAAGTQLGGPMFRGASDGSSYYMVFYGYAGGAFRVVLERAGAKAGQYYLSGAVANGSWIDVETETVAGNTVITVYVNGVQITAWTGTSFTTWTGGTVSNGVVTDNDSPLSGLYVGMTGFASTATALRLGNFSAVTVETGRIKQARRRRQLNVNASSFSINVSEGSSILFLGMGGDGTDDWNMRPVIGSTPLVAISPKAGGSAGGGNPVEWRQLFCSGPLAAGTHIVVTSYFTNAGGANTMSEASYFLCEVEGLPVAASVGSVSSPGNTISTGTAKARYGTNAYKIAIAFNQGANFTSWTNPIGYTESFNINELVTFDELDATGDIVETITRVNTGAGAATGFMAIFSTDEDWADGLTAPAVDWPLSVHASGRYLVDASGNPFHMKIACSWGTAKLPTWAFIIHNNLRILQGFNCTYHMWSIPGVEAVTYYDSAYTDYGGALPFSLAIDGSAYDMTYPYANAATDSADLNTGNDTYWNRRVLQATQNKAQGLVTIICPLFFNTAGNGWKIDLNVNGTTKAAQFGAYLKAKFAALTDSIIWWPFGGDYTPLAGDEPELEAFADALRTAGDMVGNHYAPPSNGDEVATFFPDLTINHPYSYTTIVGETRLGYAASPTKPVAMNETYYETNTITVTVLRRLGWSQIVNGIGGWSYGHQLGFPFNRNYGISMVESAGANDAYFLNDLIDEYDWHTLAPSNQGAVPNLIPVGQGTIELDTWISAAINPEGTLGVAYVGPTAGVFSFKMDGFVADVVARWYNPYTGVYTAIDTYPNTGNQSFTDPGDNGSGSNDWVLVLTSSDVPSTGDVWVSGGVRVSSEGQLVYESAAAVAFNNGNPLTANGRFAVTT